MKLYILFESASGFALFEREEMEEISVELARIQDAINSMEHFSKMIQLKAFEPFPTAEKALENMKAIADSHAPKDLIQFLEMNLPKNKGKTKVEIKIGVIDSKLGNE